MPEKDKLSWLTPKRRKTTSNLKTNGHTMAAVAEEDGSARPERPPPSPRPLSQPNAQGSNRITEGNLFYAYARKGDDLQSRYLLTFASASIANEWWLLTQAHFPGCTRPGTQLFSFQIDDFLAKAWKHPAYEHLKSKWMYIAFSATTSGGLGGAAQGIIPVQDAHGNMLGGSAPSSPDFRKELRQEARGVKDEVGRLDERFVTMMEVVQTNSESVRRLAEQKEKRQEKGDHDYFELAGHFGRMTDLMTKNMAHLENLSKRQFEQDKKLTALMESLSTKQETKSLDLSKLDEHLNRIQETMEKSIHLSGDVASSEQSVTDFSCLGPRLEKLQQAIEQNSALTKQLLEERSNEDAETRLKFQLDIMPLNESLEKIRTATEQQNAHARALHDLIQADNNQIQGHLETSNSTLAALHTAQQATTEAVISFSTTEVDFTPVATHLDAIHDHISTLVSTVQPKFSRTDSPHQQEIDLSPMTTRLDTLQTSLEKTRDYFSVQTPGGGTGDPKFLLSALSSHLSKIQTVAEQNTSAIRALKESATPAKEGSSVSLAETNQLLRDLLQALTKRQRRTSHDEKLEKRLEVTNSQVRELMAGQRDLVDVMREVAMSITAQNKESCDHVVIPPPRKVGRKIVGFVYDGKEAVL